MPCEIEASPTDLIFHWTFNGSHNLANNIPGSNYVTDQLKSSLSYRPITEEVFIFKIKIFPKILMTF